MDILRRCCGKFRDYYVSTVHIDPFKEASTIAKSCTLAYRKEFMPENTLALLPPETAQSVARRYSAKALRWLHYLCETEHTQIQHARNGGGEKKIGTYSVDGWNLEHPHLVYEFQGCLFHGCPTCYPQRDLENPFNGLTMEQLHQKTSRRRQELKDRCYKVIKKWEHECDRR